LIEARKTQTEIMKPEFERMIEIFLQAVEKKASPERENYLAEACAKTNQHRLTPANRTEIT